MIYLDYNATAPIRPEVMEAVQDAMQRPANPSSIHVLGRKARQRLEESRATIAEAIGAWPNEVVFTASGTEANNMALRGFSDRALLVGATEHSSVLKLAERMGGDILPVDNQGLINLEILETKLKALGRRALVSIMLANNETGVIQPINEISRITKAYGALLHCDAVQALGKIPFDMGMLGADILTISAHKCGGPVGIGALIIRNDLAIAPLLFGGGQELGRRAGTENVALAAGFTRAVELSASREWLKLIENTFAVMEETIIRAAPQAVIVASEIHRLGNTSCLLMPNVPSETQLMAFDLEGICISAGSACSSGRIEPSHVLLAMGYSAEEAGCAIRVSAGWDTKSEDIERFTQSWLKLWQRLSQRAA